MQQSIVNTIFYYDRNQRLQQQLESAPDDGHNSAPKHAEQRLRDKAINFTIEFCIWLDISFECLHKCYISVKNWSHIVAKSMEWRFECGVEVNTGSQNETATRISKICIPKFPIIL
jgi:hypothetical protein